MKKMLILIMIIFGTGYFTNAQVNPRALGLRIGGDGDIGEAEISYQRAQDGATRIEWDFGFGGSRNQTRIFLAGIYHWVWNIDGGLNWYAGPGAGAGLHTNDDASISVSVGGQVGLEYDFNNVETPILLSVDFRPMWDLIGEHAGLGWGAALGIRYTW